MKTQATMTGERYKLNLSLMTNEELLSEDESVHSLMMATSVKGWHYRAMLVNTEMSQRGLTTIN